MIKYSTHHNFLTSLCVSLEWEWKKRSLLRRILTSEPAGPALQFSICWTASSKHLLWISHFKMKQIKSYVVLRKGNNCTCCNVTVYILWFKKYFWLKHSQPVWFLFPFVMNNTQRKLKTKLDLKHFEPK